jgi:Domain of unknown function (DUF4411)
LNYSLDTSALLDGWRRYYPPDMFPSVWSRLDACIHTGQLMATEEVLFELAKQDDDLYKWACERKSLFVPIEGSIQPVVSSILSHHKQLVDTRKNRSGADPFVIALAKVKDGVVVTGERPTGQLDRPNIPDVCEAMGIRWLTLLQLFREQGWTF